MFNQQLFQNFNKLGICVSIHTARRALDVVRQDFDGEVLKWKAAAEKIEEHKPEKSVRRRLLLDTKLEKTGNGT